MGMKTENKKKKMRILARHKRWVAGATITESISEDSLTRRFTATIRGWQKFLIYEGELYEQDNSEAIVEEIVATVKMIRDRIDNGDDSVFNECKTSEYWIK